MWKNPNAVYSLESKGNYVPAISFTWQCPDMQMKELSGNQRRYEVAEKIASEKAIAERIDGLDRISSK